MSDLVLHFSDVRAEISGAPDEVVRALRAGWGACEVPMLPIAHEVRFTIEDDGDGARVLLDGEHAGGNARRAELVFGIERSIYWALPRWHAPPRVMLHAAGVAFGDRVFVLAGRSGAGKSSFAKALVARGGAYLSDELVISDGETLWGIPRAIQFDAVPAGAPVPPWLAGAVLGGYPPVEIDGRLSAIPLFAPARVHRAPLEVERTTIVVLERADHDSVTETSPARALAELHAGAFSPLRSDLGRLARAPLCLTWVSSETGADLLLERAVT